MCLSICVYVYVCLHIRVGLEACYFEVHKYSLHIRIHVYVFFTILYALTCCMFRYVWTILWSTWWLKSMIFYEIINKTIYELTSDEDPRLKVLKTANWSTGFLQLSSWQSIGNEIYNVINVTFIAFVKTYKQRKVVQRKSRSRLFLCFQNQWVFLNL